MDLTNVSESISAFGPLHDLGEPGDFETVLKKVLHGAEVFGSLSSSGC